MLEYIKIVLFSVITAIGYGIIHDMITAHVCVEYFSIAHPPIITSRYPLMYALVWGVVATWWVGLPLGFILAYVSRIGKYNKLGLNVLIRPLLILLGITFVIAMLSGIVGYILSLNGHIFVSSALSKKIEIARYHNFAFAAFAHGASYLMGIIGGLVLIAMVFKWRLDGRTL